MANFYWIDDTWSLSWDDAAGWSGISGGSPGTTLPANGDSVFFDANSVTSPANGPGSPISLSALSTTGFYGWIYFSLSQITITTSLTWSSGLFDGLFGPAAVAVFNGSENSSPSPLLSGTFNGGVNNNGSGPVTTAVFDGGYNHGTCLSAIFNAGAVNEWSGYVSAGTFNSDSYNFASVGSMIINGSGVNYGSADSLVITSSAGSNASGSVNGTLTVPGVRGGSGLTMNFPVASLGYFGNLALSGVTGGGGTLGGRSIEL